MITHNRKVTHARASGHMQNNGHAQDCVQVGNNDVKDGGHAKGNGHAQASGVTYDILVTYKSSRTWRVGRGNGEQNRLALLDVQGRLILSGSSVHCELRRAGRLLLVVVAGHARVRSRIRAFALLDHERERVLADGVHVHEAAFVGDFVVSFVPVDAETATD